MASPPGVPPFDKIYVIIIWISTALWGMNTVIFAGTCYVLFMKNNSTTTRVILGGTSVFLYLCITTHISLSLREELEAFVYVPQEESLFHGTLYFANVTGRFGIAKNLIYTTTVFVQDLVLIWRMYVVWTHNWKIIVFPLVVELGHIACAYAAVFFGLVPGMTIETPIVQKLGTIVGWSMEIFVNVCVTGAIVLRLWYMGRRLSFAESKGTIRTTRPSAYISTIFTLIESGAILVAVTVTLLVLFHVGSAVSLPLLDVATQIAALVPYLIIVRVGLGLTHGLPNAYKTYIETLSGEGMTFRINPLANKDGKRDLGSTTLSGTMASQSGEFALGEFRAANGSRLSV